MIGTFFGVGIGPGDPELLTMKGHRVLSTVECVAVPKATKDKESLAYQGIMDVLRPSVEVVELVMPMSKEPDVLHEAWTKAASMVYERLVVGRDVAMATIGDPLFYATFGYIAAYLERMDKGICIEVVPGITSMAASAAAIGKPLTSGSDILKVIPCTLPIQTIARELESADCAFLMKITAQLDAVLKLLKHYADRRIYLVSRAGTPDVTVQPDWWNLIGDVHYMSSIIVQRHRD